MLHAYANAVAGRSAIKSREELALLLHTRDLMLAPRRAAQQIVQPAGGLTALGVTDLSSENQPFALVPDNAFLLPQIKALMPMDEGAYLAVEATYLQAYSGEYLSITDLQNAGAVARKFLHRYGRSVHAPAVSAIAKVCDVKVPTNPMEADGEGWLNHGPDYS
jgi:hypothetical protein